MRFTNNRLTNLLVCFKKLDNKSVNFHEYTHTEGIKIKPLLGLTTEILIEILLKKMHIRSVNPCWGWGRDGGGSWGLG